MIDRGEKEGNENQQRDISKRKDDRLKWLRNVGIDYSTLFTVPPHQNPLIRFFHVKQSQARDGTINGHMHLPMSSKLMIWHLSSGQPCFG
jgi:hypothetical protein